MLFYDTGNKHNSLVHYVWHLLGDISITEYPLEDIARATNTAKYNLLAKLLKAQDDWDFDDTGNTTNFSIAISTLVEGQSDYALPTKILKAKRFEVKNKSGDWSKLKKIDESEVKGAMNEFEETDGLPKYYRLLARSIILYPAPTATQTTLAAGFRAFYDRKVNLFTGATTTTQVGFGFTGDRTIAYEVAEEYARIFREDLLNALKDRRIELENGYLVGISSRSKDDNNHLGVSFDNNE